MGKSSKENLILELFLNEPTRHWHFKDIVHSAGISEERANHWLKKLVQSRIIKKVKRQGKMPYYQGNYESVEYDNEKKAYAFNFLTNSGLFERLKKSKNKVVIIFGSFIRGDWNTESDIDLFVLGQEEIKDTYLDGREIQVHYFRNKNEIKKVRSGLIYNVIQGYFIKGSIHDLIEVKI